MWKDKTKSFTTPIWLSLLCLLGLAMATDGWQLTAENQINHRQLEGEDDVEDDKDNQIVDGADQPDEDDTAPIKPKEDVAVSETPVTNDIAKGKQRTRTNVAKQVMNEFEIQELRARYKRGEYHLTIQSIIPHGGPVIGRTQVLVRMDNLGPFVDSYPFPKCKFGTNDKIVTALYVKCSVKDMGFFMDDIAKVDGTCIQCEKSPPVDGPDIVTLAVSLSGTFDDATSSVPFRYYATPTITDIFPKSSPKNGDTVFEVTGDNFVDFGDDFRCNFGTISTKAHYKSKTHLWCRSPSADVVGRPMPFSVTMNRQQNTLQNIKMYYYNMQSIFSIEPNYGSVLKDTKILLSGANFMPWDPTTGYDYRPDIFCAFGQYGKRKGTLINNQQVECMAPPNTQKLSHVPVKITINNQNYTDDEFTFQFFNPPDIVEVEPQVGPQEGGTIIKFFGTNFERKNVTCMFGSQNVTGKYISLNQIDCPAPRMHKTGDVKVKIAYTGERIASEPVTYKVIGTPELGENLIESAANQTKVAKIVSSQINASTDAIAREKQTAMQALQIQSKGSTSEEKEEMIKDVNQKIKEIAQQQHQIIQDVAAEIGVTNKACGPVTGYTQFTIMGKNFIENGFGNTKCIFNNTIYMNATVIDKNTLVCNSPPLEQSSGDMFYFISITFDGLFIANSTTKFWYYNDPKIKSVTPGMGPLAGGTEVLLIGRGFNQTNICDLTLKMEQKLVPFKLINDTAIQFTTPKANVSGALVVSLSGNNQQYIDDLTLHYRDDENTFLYFQPFEIKTISPDSVTTEGNTPVVITGMNFDQFKFDNGTHKDTPIYCRFAEDNEEGKVIGYPKRMQKLNNQDYMCPSPKSEYNGESRIELSTNQQQWQSLGSTPVGNVPATPPIGSPSKIKFFNGPKVTSVSPTSGVTKNPKKLKLTIMGENFECPKNDCSHIKVRFTNDKQDKIIIDGTKEGSNIMCKIPTYPAPETLRVDVSLNGVDFTNSKVTYGFMDPFALRVTPHIINPVGSTDLTLHGYGFVQQEDGKNKIKFQASKGNLTCAQGPKSSEEGAPPPKYADCIADYTVINEHTIKVPSFDRSMAQLDGSPFTDDYFLIELMDMDGQYSRNDLRIWYYQDIKLSNMSAEFAYSNEEKPIIMEADFLWNKGNDYSILKDHANMTCRFTGGSPDVPTVVIVQGLMETAPLGEYLAAKLPNQIRCRTPKWNSTGQVKLDVSINGIDYVGNFQIIFVEPLNAVKISPLAGPISGGTKIKFYGSGYNAAIPKEKEIYVRFGVMESQLLDKASVQEQDRWSSDNYHDNEVHLPKSILYDAEAYDEPVQDDQIFRTYLGALSPNIQKLFDTNPYSIDGQGGPVYIQLSEKIPIIVKDHKKDDGQTITDYIETVYSDSSKLEYYFYRNPTVNKVEPLSGLADGGTKIAITGAWFQKFPEYGVYPFCKIGDTLIRAEYIATNRIICRSPPSADTTNALPISVSLNGVDFVETKFKFSYYEKPILNDIQPKSGKAEGGTEIWLKGAKFSNINENQKMVRCRFRQIEGGIIDDENAATKYVPAYWIDKETMKCGSPTGWQGGNTVRVDLTFNGVDFTDNSFNFDLYNVFGNFPKSGPADASNQVIQVKGKGFRSAFTISCSLNNVEIAPVKVKHDGIMCPMVLPDWPADKYESVPFFITIDGVKHNLGVFHYYKQIVIESVNPLLGPNEGVATVFIMGRYFKADFENAKPACRVGNTIAVAYIVDTETVRCVLKKKVPLVDEGQSLPITFALNSYSWGASEFSYYPYGIENIYPTSGPNRDNTIINVVGKGFQNEMSDQARCKFGTDGNYQIVEAQVLDNEHLICKSPSEDLDIPSTASDEISVPFSIAFQDDIYYPYTAGIHKFRMYNHPQTIDVDPAEAKVDKLTEVYVYAQETQGFVQPIPSPGKNYIDTDAFGLKCKFGRFGTSSATYINTTTILCLTPNIQEDPSDIGEEQVIVSVAMNGVDFNEQDSRVTFTFVGTGSNISVWVIIMLTFVLALLIISIWFFISGLQAYWNNKNRERQPNVVLDQTGHFQPASGSSRMSRANDIRRLQQQANERVSQMRSRAVNPNSRMTGRDSSANNRFL